MCFSSNPRPLTLVSYSSIVLLLTLLYFPSSPFSHLFLSFFFFLNDTAPPEIYPLPLPDALPISFSWKVRRETLLGLEEGVPATPRNISPLAAASRGKQSKKKTAFRPARVLMKFFTGAPA